MIHTWFNVAKISIYVLLFSAAVTTFDYLRKKRVLQTTFKRAYEYLDISARQRLKENQDSGKKGKWMLSKVDERLQYSGFKRKFPFLTTELWIVTMLLLGAVSYFIVASFSGWAAGMAAMLISIVLLSIIERIAIYRNFKDTEEQLLVFLNLLENYSITASEITGIFFKVSKYLKEPLKNALTECYFEAQTSGNTSKALFKLSDKVEHPKFKELIKNVEICGRYEADYRIVVQNSRKSIQDYISYRKKKQSVIRIARANMFVLGVTGIVTFTIFDKILSGSSIWELLFTSVFGHNILLYFGVIVTVFVISTAFFDK